jgi:hypothetical protein
MKSCLAFLISLLSFSVFAQTEEYREMNRPYAQFVGPMLPAPPEKLIQVVFVLDATGSMSGLIGTAKEKIWSITSGLAQAEYTRVEIGLLFYRDRGDAFITSLVPISKELDDVYEQLMKISAQGGGDMDESVNQGLYEGVTLMNWSSDTSAFKSIFLVGDYPPHMDYADDVKYPVSCQLAKEKGITLNTILMGNNRQTEKIWREISSCAGGDFIQTGMNANNLQVYSPYDDSIAVISGQLDDTRIYYGEKKMKQQEKVMQSEKFKKQVSASSNARRAEYYSTKSGKSVYYGEKELLNDVGSKGVKVDSLKKEQLPDFMAAMTPEQRNAYVSAQIAKREELNKKLALLVQKRKEYIDAELKKRSTEDVKNSFDYKVYEITKKQAEKKRIEIKGDAKY